MNSAEKPSPNCLGQVNFPFGQVKMEVWWSDGQVKLASIVSVAVADNDREQDQARILPPLPQLLCSDTDTE